MARFPSFVAAHPTSSHPRTPQLHATLSPMPTPHSRGPLTDWVTQLWVRLTGRRVSPREQPWLDAPVGDVDAIGSEFFERHAARHGLTLDEQTTPRGLLPDFSQLAGPSFDPKVVDFYERTSLYDLDVWSEWSARTRPQALDANSPAAHLPDAETATRAPTGPRRAGANECQSRHR